MLSGLSIKNCVNNGTIIINPFNLNQLGPNSYDLKLGDEIRSYVLNEYVCEHTSTHYLDSSKKNISNIIDLPSDGIILFPNKLYLAATMEIAGSSHYVPCIEGRSSLARLGLQVHMTAGFGDIGFIGRWTLEMTVVHPVKIYPNMRICQIYFEEISGDYMLYNGKYTNSRSVIDSMSYKDVEFNK